MHNLLYLALLCTLLFGWEKSGSFGDPCQIMPQGPSDQHTTIDVQADPGCRNGTFWWNYPQGNIRLQFRHKTTSFFRVCLKDYLGGNIFTLFDVTSDMTVVMPSVTRESSTEVCTRVHRYEVVILFEAPRYMYDMGEVAYHVEFIYPE